MVKDMTIVGLNGKIEYQVTAADDTWIECENTRTRKDEKKML